MPRSNSTVPTLDSSACYGRVRPPPVEKRKTNQAHESRRKNAKSECRMFGTTSCDNCTDLGSAHSAFFPPHLLGVLASLAFWPPWRFGERKRGHLKTRAP
ncbi:unnamed protein product, partial [Iphiclides podalirius]